MYLVSVSIVLTLAPLSTMLWSKADGGKVPGDVYDLRVCSQIE